MKNWLKIFKDETESTPAEIKIEIETLQQTRTDIMVALEGLQTKLETKRIERLGGQGKSIDIKKLKEQESEELENIKAVDIAVEKLKQLYQTAIEQEKNSAIADINQALVDLETNRKELTTKLLKASGEAAALSFLLRGGQSFTLGPNNYPVELIETDRQPFLDQFNDVVNSQIPLTAKHQDLIAQRTALLN